MIRDLYPDPNKDNPYDKYDDYEPVNYKGIEIEEGWKTSFKTEIVHNGCVVKVQIDYFEQEIRYFFYEGERIVVDKMNKESHVPKIYMLVGNDRTQIRYSVLDLHTRNYIIDSCEYHMVSNNQEFYKEEREV